MSNFDPEAFMGTETTDDMDTQVIPIPEDEYTAVVEKVEARLTKVDNVEKPVLEVTWLIDDTDGSVQKATGRDKNTVRQSIWLDVNESGALATGPGKNIGLGRLREVFGQNKAGKAWNPNMLTGNPARILVNQRVDKNDPEVIYNGVKRVAAL